MRPNHVTLITGKTSPTQVKSQHPQSRESLWLENLKVLSVGIGGIKPKRTFIRRISRDLTELKAVGDPGCTKNRSSEMVSSGQICGDNRAFTAICPHMAHVPVVSCGLSLSHVPKLRGRWSSLTGNSDSGDWVAHALKDHYSSFVTYTWVFSPTFWPCLMVYGILLPCPGIEPVPPALEAEGLNHWTAREVPKCIF